MNDRLKRNIIPRIVAAAILLTLTIPEALAQIEGISCCDWMMLKRQKIGAFALAKDINADGVEMDMGGLGRRVLFDNRFRGNEKDTKQFRAAADSLGIQVHSMAMSGFFAQSLIKRNFDEYTTPEGKKECRTHTDAEHTENYRQLFADCFETMEKFGAKVAFLPLGGSGSEWQKGSGEEYDILCSRLRMAGEMARQHGVVIGIRTQMPAEFSKKMLQDIGSKGILLYYNFQDACDRFKAGQTEGASSSTELICRELKTLGRKRICQIHVSNTDRVTLRHDTDIDMQEVKKTLQKIKYCGWLTVERSRNAQDVRNVKGNFGDNVAYLKEVFF